MVEMAAVVMIVSSFILGYGVRAMRHPAVKRDARGRFVKE